MLRRELHLRDGRRLDVVEVGEPHGAPVVLLHGTPGGPLEVVGCEAEAVSAGVRLLCAARPGYAGSSVAPPGLTTVVADVASLAAELGITRFGVLGVSGGAPYAAALAASLPAEVTGLALLAGAGPVELQVWGDDPDDREERRAVELAQAGRPEEAATIMRALVERWLTDVVKDPRTPVPETIRTSILDGTRAGTDGPVFDALTIATAWDVDVTGVRCPTALVYGESDVAVPPAHGAWYQERIPHATLTVVPAADHPGTIQPAYATVLPWLAALA